MITKRRTKYLQLLTFFLIALCSPSFAKTDVADDGKWKKESESSGFNVYERIDPKSGILPIKVDGIINAPIDAVMENLRTIEGSESWTPDLLEKTTLEDRGPKEAITYSLSDMPWPLYDRTLILENKLFLDKERKLLFVLSKTVNYKDAPRPKHTIEAFVGYSNMGFRPVTKKKTYVEITAFIDPKGSIPTWIINFYQQKWPIEFLKALEKRALQSKKPLRTGLKPMLRDLLELMKWDLESFES